MLWRILDWLLCQHEWVDKERLKRFRCENPLYGDPSKSHFSGYVYIKECKKCQRVWSQNAP